MAKHTDWGKFRDDERQRKKKESSKLIANVTDNSSSRRLNKPWKFLFDFLQQIDDQLAEPAVDTLQSNEKPELQYYSSELLHNYRNLFPDPTEKCQPPTAEYGNFIYPAYAPPSEYYSNGVYYCDPRPPPRFKRRKRYPSYRNQQPRSTETTTDDENTTSHNNNTRFNGNYKYQSGVWQPRYFYDRSRVDYWDQNVRVQSDYFLLYF